jgi:peptidoglycan/xylan/chitin deacetylase (PgdA/CDA1 family)
VENRVPILTYHKIAPIIPNTIYPGTFVPPELFRKHLRHLVRRGYQTNRLADIFQGNTPANPIVLTFDDGFQDFAENAFPALSEYAFQSTVFLVANHLGGLNDWDIAVGDTPAPLMNATTIQDLAKKGVEFGSHTLTHAHLDQLSEAEQDIEVGKSRLQLQSELGLPIETFCFPYGGHNAYTLTAAEQAGYKVSVSTRKGINDPSTPRHCLKRIAIRHDTSLPIFIYKLWRAKRLGK